MHFPRILLFFYLMAALEHKAQERYEQKKYPTFKREREKKKIIKCRINSMSFVVICLISHSFSTNYCRNISTFGLNDKTSKEKWFLIILECYFNAVADCYCTHIPWCTEHISIDLHFEWVNRRMSHKNEDFLLLENNYTKIIVKCTC